MKNEIEAICDTLDQLASAIKQASNEDRTLLETRGWNHVPLTRHEIANIASNLAENIRSNKLKPIETTSAATLKEIPKKLQSIQSKTLQYMFNGHGQYAIPVFITTMTWISSLFEEKLDWESLSESKAMPAQLARKLRGIQTQLDTLIPDKTKLEEQIRLIHDATETAESLPADLQTLKDTRKTIHQLSNDSEALYVKIDAKFKEANGLTQKITASQQDAQKLVQQCEEAYRITTTKGLAAAFDQRANRLTQSMWIWVLGLLAALMIGAQIGTKRIELLSSAIANTPEWGVIFMHIILSLLSVSAPLWFAWLATKQIGQRFRLAEDYGFKASVAKAYEGYRKEAARIDSAFEARLFSSALTRLEEAPLRLVEEISHGSPWHELISSKSFQRALDTVPELKDTFIDISKKGVEKVASQKRAPKNQTLENEEK